MVVPVGAEKEHSNEYNVYYIVASHAHRPVAGTIRNHKKREGLAKQLSYPASCSSSSYLLVSCADIDIESKGQPPL